MQTEVTQARDPAGAAKPILPLWMTLGLTTGLVGFFAYLCALAVHRDCYEAAPPVLIPQAGTPRGDYCAAIERVPLVATLTVVPALTAALAILLLHRRPRIATITVVLIVLATLANAIIAASLQHVHLGPLNSP